jgi:hypothetical protein
MSSFAQAARRVGDRRGLILLVGGAFVAALVVPAVFARAEAVPANTAHPGIAVPPTVGDTMTATQGTWSNSPTSFAYQWLHCPASGGAADGSDCTAVPGATRNAIGVDRSDVGNPFRVRVTATNADGSASAVSDATPATLAAPDANITGCPPVQEAGPLGLDEISPPARLVVDRTRITPSVITRTTQTITVGFHVIACDAREVRGALVYATATPFQQFTNVERPTGSDGWANLTMTRQRFFPATPQQQNLIVFVRARKPGEPLLEGISSRRLVSFRVRL